MYFNTTADTGHQVSGYYVPDSFSGASVIRIVHGRGEPILFEANEVIPSLVTAGRHETGRCGFRIDETVVPGLAEIDDLEIMEPETGLRIYRRRPVGTVVSARLLRLETHLLPLWQVDDVFERSFQFFYKSIEKFGHETVAQIMLLQNAGSLYAGGRFLYKSYEQYIDSGDFQSICMFRDPYDELAERLLILKNASNGEVDYLDERDKLMFDDAIRFASTLDFSSERQIRRAFRSISSMDATIFSDPFVRSLTARTPDEAVKDNAISNALEILSTFSVVGLRTYPQMFMESLAARLDADPGDMPLLSEPAPVTDLGHILRDIGTVRTLIERDLELYSQVKTALESVM